VVVFLVTAQVCLIRLNFVRMASFIQNTHINFCLITES
jgi:hypothetical protein